MSIEYHHSNPGETNDSPESVIPAAIKSALDDFSFDASALSPDINGEIDHESFGRLMHTAALISPHMRAIDVSPDYKYRGRDVINHVRRVPAAIGDYTLSESSRDSMRVNFEFLPTEAIDRLVSIDFPSYHALRMFPAEVVRADLSDEVTEYTLDQMKFDLSFYRSINEIDKVFDIYEMDKEKDGDDEDEDGELTTEGDEQKAMRYVLTRLMLPLRAKFYDQVMNAVDKFTRADYDVSEMDDDVLNALALIDSLGQADTEVYDEMLANMDLLLDEREWERWELFILQLKHLDSSSDKWKQLLVDVDAMNKQAAQEEKPSQPEELRLAQLMSDIDDMISNIEQRHMDVDGRGRTELQPVSEWDDPDRKHYNARKSLTAIRSEFNAMMTRLRYQRKNPDQSAINDDLAERVKVAEDKFVRLKDELQEELAKPIPVPGKAKRIMKGLFKGTKNLYDRTRNSAPTMSDDEILNYLEANLGVKRQDDFLGHMYRQVTGHGIKSLKPNERRGIEETAAADRHFGRHLNTHE